ncbi:Gfo/Idh/MocA family protein [Paludisphaera rhizosphaerae]|uniref:Gfo/Idh/MocA family protein n=1 Tax=Paludisphaera rhizosphaerae TaxID=2711216 RepID=UPI0013EC02AF|nr:Gfo/Idh/MocA family oxidoreductase [Paludisphaera rhizosphaerae]
MRESSRLHRRGFLGAAGAAGFAVGTAGKVLGANETITVGVMGLGGRGQTHASTFAGTPGVRVAYVCDVDESRTGATVDRLTKAKREAPKGVGDFRRILDDKGVDALIVATCNHWHAPASWLACEAGKHVYVEKPCSHTPHEGEVLIAAARKANKVVQMGNQKRSWPKVMEGISKVREGAIGTPYLARCWYSADRGSIGKGVEGPPPAKLDYELWQGPSTRRPFRSNILHYNWHWFWHWGNGELGNNGVHTLDLCRWGLGVDFPTRVVSQGGRYCFDDDQETPDTHIASYEFGSDKLISWEGLSCSPFRPGDATADATFWGDKGTLSIIGGGYVVYDHKGKEIDKATGAAGDKDHVANFLAAIRDGAKLNSEIAEGHKSTLLCHLGNIAHRTGRALACDPKDGRILNDSEAMTLWTKEYAPGWEPPK